MTDANLSKEDEDAIREILIGYKESGIDRPLLPADVDMSGDGVVDAFGLDADGKVELVSQVSLADTVYLSEGEDRPGEEGD